MRAESTIKPSAPFDIEVNGDMATIRFYQNVELLDPHPDEEEETTERWAYDEHCITVRNRPDLAQHVETNLEAWVQLAIAEEAKPKPEGESEKLVRLAREIDDLNSENAMILLELAKSKGV